MEIDDLLDDESWDLLNSLTEEELQELNEDFDPDEVIIQARNRSVRSESITSNTVVRDAKPMFNKEDLVEGLEKMVENNKPVFKNEKIRQKEEKKKVEREAKLKKQYSRDRPEIEAPRQIALTAEEEELLNEATEEELIEAAETALSRDLHEVRERLLIAIEKRKERRLCLVSFVNNNTNQQKDHLHDNTLDLNHNEMTVSSNGGTALTVAESNNDDHDTPILNGHIENSSDGFTHITDIDLNTNTTVNTLKGTSNVYTAEAPQCPSLADIPSQRKMLSPMIEESPLKESLSALRPVKQCSVKSSEMDHVKIGEATRVPRTNGTAGKIKLTGTSGVTPQCPSLTDIPSQRKMLSPMIEESPLKESLSALRPVKQCSVKSSEMDHVKIGEATRVPRKNSTTGKIEIMDTSSVKEREKSISNRSPTIQKDLQATSDIEIPKMKILHNEIPEIKITETSSEKSQQIVQSQTSLDGNNIDYALDDVNITKKNNTRSLETAPLRDDDAAPKKVKQLKSTICEKPKPTAKKSKRKSKEYSIDKVRRYNEKVREYNTKIEEQNRVILANTHVKTDTITAEGVNCSPDNTVKSQITHCEEKQQIDDLNLDLNVSVSNASKISSAPTMTTTTAFESGEPLLITDAHNKHSELPANSVNVALDIEVSIENSKQYPLSPSLSSSVLPSQQSIDIDRQLEGDENAMVSQMINEIAKRRADRMNKSKPEKAIQVRDVALSPIIPPKSPCPIDDKTIETHASRIKKGNRFTRQSFDGSFDSNCSYDHVTNDQEAAPSAKPTGMIKINKTLDRQQTIGKSTQYHNDEKDSERLEISRNSSRSFYDSGIEQTPSDLEISTTALGYNNDTTLQPVSDEENLPKVILRRKYADRSVNHRKSRDLTKLKRQSMDLSLKRRSGNFSDSNFRVASMDRADTEGKRRSGSHLRYKRTSSKILMARAKSIEKLDKQQNRLSLTKHSLDHSTDNQVESGDKTLHRQPSLSRDRSMSIEKRQKGLRRTGSITEHRVIIERRDSFRHQKSTDKEPPKFKTHKAKFIEELNIAKKKALAQMLKENRLKINVNRENLDIEKFNQAKKSIAKLIRQSANNKSSEDEFSVSNLLNRFNKTLDKHKISHPKQSNKIMTNSTTLTTSPSKEERVVKSKQDKRELFDTNNMNKPKFRDSTDGSSQRSTTSDNAKKTKTLEEKNTQRVQPIKNDEKDFKVNEEHSNNTKSPSKTKTIADHEDKQNLRNNTKQHPHIRQEAKLQPINNELKHGESKLEKGLPKSKTEENKLLDKSKLKPVAKPDNSIKTEAKKVDEKTTKLEHSTILPATKKPSTIALVKDRTKNAAAALFGPRKAFNKSKQIDTETHAKQDKHTPPSQTTTIPKKSNNTGPVDFRARLRKIEKQPSKDYGKKERLNTSFLLPEAERAQRKISGGGGLAALLAQDEKARESLKFGAKPKKADTEEKEDIRGISASSLQKALLNMNGILTNEQINSVWAGDKPKGSITKKTNVKATEIKKDIRISGKDEETELDVVELMKNIKADSDALFYLCINNQPKLEKKVKESVIKAVETSTKIRHVSFVMIGLIDHEIQKLAEALRFNDKIETINLESNIITQHGLTPLMKEIARHPSIREVKIANQKQPFGGQGEECMATAIDKNENILKFGYSFQHAGPRNKADRAIIRHNEKVRQQRRNGEEVYDLKAMCKIRDPWPQPWIKVKNRRGLGGLIESKASQIGSRFEAGTEVGRESSDSSQSNNKPKAMGIDQLLSQRKAKLKGANIEELEKAQEQKRKQQFKEMHESESPTDSNNNKNKLPEKYEEKEKNSIKQNEKSDSKGQPEETAPSTTDKVQEKKETTRKGDKVASLDKGDEKIPQRRRRKYEDDDDKGGIDFGSFEKKDKDVPSKVKTNAEEGVKKDEKESKPKEENTGDTIDRNRTTRSRDDDDNDKTTSERPRRTTRPRDDNQERASRRATRARDDDKKEESLSSSRTSTKLEKKDGSKTESTKDTVRKEVIETKKTPPPPVKKEEPVVDIFGGGQNNDDEGEPKKLSLRERMAKRGR